MAMRKVPLMTPGEIPLEEFLKPRSSPKAGRGNILPQPQDKAAGVVRADHQQQIAHEFNVLAPANFGKDLPIRQQRVRSRVISL